MKLRRTKKLCHFWATLYARFMGLYVCRKYVCLTNWLQRVVTFLSLVVGRLAVDCVCAVHMDSSESAVGGPTDCGTVRPIHNNDMQEGDYYIVQSDSWHGKADPWHGTSHLARRPAECALAFNFGDRLASMTVDEWWCHLRDVHDPFLAIYNNCAGQRYGLLVSINAMPAQAFCFLVGPSVRASVLVVFLFQYLSLYFDVMCYILQT